MPMHYIKQLSEHQKLRLTEQLHALAGFGDMREDRLLGPVFVDARLAPHLLDELATAGFIERRDGRVYPGPDLPRDPQAKAVQARRDELMKASPLGRAMLAADTPKKA